jgi:hypothetical protein
MRFGSPPDVSTTGMSPQDLRSAANLVLLPIRVTNEGTVFAFSATINKSPQKFDFQIYRPVTSGYQMISRLTVTPSVTNQQEIVSRSATVNYTFDDSLKGDHFRGNLHVTVH